MNRLWRGPYVLDTGVHNSPYATPGPTGDSNNDALVDR